MIEMIIGGDDARVQETLATIITKDADVFGAQERVAFSTRDKEFDLVHVKQAVLTPSLFDPRKVITLRLYDKDLNQEQEGFLADILHHVPTDVLMVVVLDKKPLVKSALKKIMDQHARVHKVETLRDFERGDYIAQQVKRAGLTLSASAMGVLQERIGSDWVRLHHELEKLRVLDRPIGDDDLKLIVPKSLDDNIFLLSDAVLKENLREMILVYQDLLALKIDPLALFGMLASSLRKNYQVNVLARQGKRAADIAEQLAMSEKQAHFIMRNQNKDPYFTLKLLDSLASKEQQAKQGKIDRFLAIELFFIAAAKR